MLRASAQATGTTAELSTVHDPAAPGGVPFARELADLVAAIVDLDAEAAAGARATVRDRLGDGALVDAVAVVANFEMMTRIADGTGTPLDKGTIEPTEAIRADLDIDEFTSARL